MVFTNIPPELIDKNTNPDYEMEFFWYGIKSLIKNYYHYLVDDNNIKYSILIDDISSELNELQKSKKYDEIYKKIFDFLLNFLKSLIIVYINFETIKNNYIFSWIKRYNKIPNCIKLEIDNKYNKSYLFTEIKETDLIIIKLRIIENEYAIELLNLLDSNKFDFLDMCLEYGYENIFDYISLRFNIDDYYKFNEFNIKGPYKAKKIINSYFKELSV